jgi:hypothetical protein
MAGSVSRTWAVDTAIALAEMGGQGHLSQIYEIVVRARQKRGDTLGEAEAWVRHALQSNSRGKGLDWFVHLGAPRSGVWGFNKLLTPGTLPTPCS